MDCFLSVCLSVRDYSRPFKVKLKFRLDKNYWTQIQITCQSKIMTIGNCNSKVKLIALTGVLYSKSSCLFNISPWTLTFDPKVKWFSQSTDRQTNGCYQISYLLASLSYLVDNLQLSKAWVTQNPFIWVIYKIFKIRYDSKSVFIKTFLDVVNAYLPGFVPIGWDWRS